MVLSISMAYTLLSVSVSKTVEMKDPYKIFSIIFYILLLLITNPKTSNELFIQSIGTGENTEY